MPVADLLYNADVAQAPDCGCNKVVTTTTTGTCNCNPNGAVWFVPPPPPKPMDYPPYPFPYGYPCVPPVEPAPVKKNSKEAEICKLSKKSATIKKMIENFTEKNKNAIIKIGETSYNFGAYKVITTDITGGKVEEDSKYGEAILGILTDELAAIKEKLQELSNELDEDDE